MLLDISLEQYLADIDEAPTPGDDEIDDTDNMAYAAARAFANMVDEAATVEDLTAYRAWITARRLGGSPENELASSISVANYYAHKLGVD